MTSRRDVAAAGFRGDEPSVRAALVAEDPVLRATALGALARLDRLEPDDLTRGVTDPAAVVRVRAAELAAHWPGFSLVALLDDPDPLVAEMAAWACGEHESVDEETFARLVQLVSAHADPLVREAAVAALGALGDERGKAAVLAATSDKAPIRRRAVIALVAFDGDDVDAAIRRALDDRDWQVREAAEELLRDD